MGQHEDTPDVSRRDLGALLGVLGGAAGLAALASCSSGGDAVSERTGSVAQPWAAGDAGAAGTTVMWVDTIVAASGAFLRNTATGSDVGSGTGNSSTPVAIVGGYGVPGDGGGGVFYWSASSITDDGGTKIVPAPTDGGAAGVGASGPGWVRIHSGSLNVQWFGATGNGQTDDTNAIQAAIAAVPPSGGEVHLPAGTYKIHSTIALASHTRVRGVFGSIVDNSNSSPGGTVLRWAGSSSQPVVQVYGAEYVVIDGIAVDFNGVASCSAFYIDSNNAPASHNIVIQNFSVCDSSGMANTTGVGVQIGPLSGSSSYQMDRVRLQNFYLLDMGTGININSSNAADAGVIDGGTFQNVVTGINLQACGYIIMRSCAFGQAAGSTGIRISGDPINMLIESCQAEGSGNMLVIASPATPDSAYPIILQNNIFNLPSTVSVYRRIVSIANYFSSNFTISVNYMGLTSIDDRFGTGASFVTTGTTGVQIFSVSPGASSGQMALTPLSLPQSVNGTFASGTDNNDVAIGSNSFVRVSGPSGPFSVTGFAGGTDGRVLHVMSPIYGMTIKNATGSALGNQILTLTGADVTLGSGASVASFLYDTAAGYWVLTSYQSA